VREELSKESLIFYNNQKKDPVFSPDFSGYYFKNSGIYKSFRYEK